MRHDYPERLGAGAFATLEKEGVRARRLIPPFPASTFPSHATLVTGCYPERHGILNSRFLDSRRGEFDRSEDPDWLACEPIWVTAEKRGIRTAVLNWVGSYGPWRGIEASIHERSFRPLGDREAIRRVLSWLDRSEGQRPRLMLAYLAGTDHAGHQEGPDSLAVDRKIHLVDGVLASLLAGLDKRGMREDVNLMIVTDHGMAAVTGWLDPHATLVRRRVRHRILASGGTANVYLERNADRGWAKSALSGIAGLEVFEGGSLPGDLRYQFPGRTGNLVLLAPLGVGIRSGGGGEGGELAGVHGFRGTEDAMAGIFYARGPVFPRSRQVDRLDAVDVAPLVCAALGIGPPRDSQGEIREGLLRLPKARRPRSGAR